jgi:hypothetical protein
MWGLRREAMLGPFLKETAEISQEETLDLFRVGTSTTTQEETPGATLEAASTEIPRIL